MDPPATDASAYFGDDFGQKIDLTVRIREILRNYPEGTSIFKEMVQNADDAGATEVNFCIDYRQHGSTRLAYTKLEPFQGPALVVHNNATFTDADFASIQRIGDSLKKDNSKGWKTGRFGVGFNSVYHVTDLPAFVSGSHLVFFDPQACHLPNVNPSNPGKLINFVTHPELVQDFPDQIAPFRCFGCDFGAPFSGTLFRLALRTESQAQASKLSSRAQQPEHVAAMLREFADDLSRVMLFLRNVTKISIYEWRDGHDAPALLDEAAICNLTPEIQAKRSLKFANFGADNAQLQRFSTDGIPCDYMLAIQIYRSVEDATETLQYFVLNQLGGGECAKIANDPANASQRLVPWGGVAVLLPSQDDPSSFHPLAGMAFCFLPLPTLTYLPIHVNGYFELSSNRRDIWFGDGLSGEGLLRAQWNLALLSDVIAPCYARAVTSLAGDGTAQMAPEQHVWLFPQVQPPAPWDTLAHSFFARISAEPCLYTEADGGSWIAPASSAIVRRDAPDYSRFVHWLLVDNHPVVRNLSDELEKFLVKTKTVPSFLEPSRVRSAYRGRTSRHAGDSDAVRCLLDFMVSDLSAADDLAALVGVAFLPIADGTLAPFANQASVDVAALEYLCSMGFSRQHSIRALEEVGGQGVEAGLNWLFQNPNPSMLAADGNRIYLIPNAEELALLQSARSSLVAIDAMSTPSMALLSSESAAQHLNVKKMDFQDFEDMLAIVLPSSWYGQATVAWDYESDDEPNAAWFRLLWKYIGPSAHVSSFQDKWPIVPTSSGVLTSLSKASGVVTPELLPPGCLQCLQQIDVRLLLPNLFASFNPDPSVWQHIHQPTPAGVLSCIGAIAAAASASTPSTSSVESLSVMERVFKNASAADRDHLRTFLMSAHPDELDAPQRRVCQQLPIFHGFQSVQETASSSVVSWVVHDASDDGVESSASEQVLELTSSTSTPAFVSLQRAHRDNDASAFMCVGIAWKFLDDDFIYVKEGDTALWKFLFRLGVRAVSKVDFFVNHLIPRFQRLPHESRIEFIYQLLLEMNTLLAQDTHGKLSGVIEVATIFPTASGDLKAISDLYDPEVDDFAELMDDSFFPALELQDAQPLSVLRTLGLQRTISRRSILSLALSLENEQIKLASRSNDDMEAMTAKLRARADVFFKYLDAHMDRLMSVETVQRQKRAKTNMKSKGLRFLRSFGLPTQTEMPQPPRVSEAESLEQQMYERREIEEFAAQLAVIEWVPVSRTKPHPACPLYLETENIVVTSPSNARPIKYLWLCSAQHHIISSVAYSEHMNAAFGWNALVPIPTVAFQLKQIARNFGTYAASHGGRVDTQLVWSAVYSIYKILSKFFESELDAHRRDEVLAVLSGESAYVWVGNHFVSPSHVAMSAYVNAEPYLFTIPSEQLHFRPLWKALGVQERFALSDYIHVISAMHAKCQQPLASPDVLDAAALALASDELAIAIGLLQQISDMLSHHSDYELFAPDTAGILVSTANLTFDDTPWLDASRWGDAVSRLRFVHPKISNKVAHKLGCKSLRGQLLHADHADSSLFTVDGGVERFGQTEALTKRIAHILEQYPDGPNIISELVQNADDAGATRVALLYNSVTYGASSLLSANMARWQGPALYCYNDAEFSDSDFINLARIGQAKKLQRATTTGRFGLGFNSVYHFTDLPAIVSAKSIVIFDPHANNLPGITAANPGIKVRFVDSDLPEQFPDQFAPFKDVFGCDLRRHYNGTLFRFPLRTAALAEASEIKRRAYAQTDILDLFRTFKTTIASTMLFLRNVRKVDVYVQTEMDQPPVLLFGAEVPTEDRGESWRQIDKFMASSSDAPQTSTVVVNDVTSKRQFYERLRLTRESELPSVTQVVHIRSYEHEAFDACLRAIEDVSSSAHSLPDAREKTLRVEKYLVCNQLGGGRARELACAAGNESLKLIPWAGIAGRLDEAAVEGRAFCFLPLPVKIGLPVHVNGYFELSSNRRDIWHGDDMAGDGKLRSEWNESLLSDAVAPAYLSFLLEARRVCGDDMAQYFSFFPSQLPSGPWATVVRSLFRRMANTLLFAASPVLLTNDAVSDVRRYVAPKSCVVIDETIAGWELLEKALATAVVSTVHAPAPLRELLVQLDAVYGAMTPAFFCALVRRGDFLPRLPRNLVERVVEFCTTGASGSPVTLELLHDLPLLPLRSGAFGRFCIGESHSSDAIVYFGSAVEEELLELFPSRMVEGAFRPYFEALPAAVYASSNVQKMRIDTLAREFFPKLFAGCWRKVQLHSYEVFALEPAAAHTNDSRVSDEWLRKWWKYVELTLQAGDEWSAEMIQNWPVIPVRARAEDAEVRWLSFASNPCLLVDQAGSSQSTDTASKMAEVLSKVCVYVVDTSFVSGDRSTEWLLRSKIAFKLDSDGLLLALSKSQRKQAGGLFERAFASITSPERQTLCEFFAANSVDAISDSCLPMLEDLPIFAVHTGNAFRAINDDAAAHVSATQSHTSLRQRRIIPAADSDVRVLDESYYVVDSDAVRRFLIDLQLDESTYTAILMEHVFPRLEAIEANDPSLVDAVVVDALQSLPFHQRKDKAFRECVRSLRVIPSRTRVLRRVSELHDPTSKELSELVGSSSLPAEALSTPEIVEVLRSLGLRTSLSCHAILESARSVEELYERRDVDSVELAWAKAVNLIKLVNKHFDDMASSTDNNEAIVEELKRVVWLPVHAQPLEPGMPWRLNRVSEDLGLANERRLSSALETRPKEDAWLCSSSYDIMAESLSSDVLLTAFGWRESVEPLVLAAQVEAIGVAFESSQTIVASRGGSDDDIAPVLPKHSALKAQELYLLLDAARGNAARARSDDASEDASNAFDAVYEKLADAPWIWTGKVFARPSRIAYEADPALEPLLFAAPHESILSRAFLDKFALRQSFGVDDYLDTLARLPHGVVLTESVIKACVKLYALLSADTAALRDAVARLPSSKRVLLSASNRLEASAHLTVDDMAWNESHAAREGYRFVSAEIARDVAFALGAASLHTKHAESTGASAKVACPSVEKLRSVLPSDAKTWYAAFFSEVLLAAERFGSTQTDVFIDYRQHPPERVILPTLQSLQHTAVCIHVHDVKLTSGEIGRLYGGESSRAGLLSGFFVSDCMQILSGDGFFVLDPSGAYLSSSSSTDASARAVGRRYDILAESFMSYPDQLLPFCSLPSCPGNVAKGTQSTLIRFPLRTTASELGKFVPNASAMSRLVTSIKRQMRDALIFTESVAHVSVWSIGKNSEYESHCHADAKLASPQETLRRRKTTRESTEWQKKFSLQSFFKSAIVPESQLEFIVDLDIENRQHRDTWLLCDNIGAGRSRDLACSPVHEALRSTPYVSVACHLYRDGSAPSQPLHGQVYKIVGTGEYTGLPVHINGCFKKAMKETSLLLVPPTSGFSSSAAIGSEAQVKATWNRTLLEDGVVSAYSRLLLVAKRRYESTSPKALYSVWPRLHEKHRKNDVGQLVHERVYQGIASHELFLCTDGNFRTLANGYMVDLVGMDIQVASFAQLHFPAFSMPRAVLTDCTRMLSTRMQKLTPRAMRRFLQRMRASELHASVSLPLLEYCLSDLPLPLPSETSAIWSEFNALPLLPLEDGSTGTIRLNQRSGGFVLGTFNQVQLLAPRTNMFVSLEARQRLHAYFGDSRFVSVMGLSFFSIKTLSDHIDQVLPACWKHQDVVVWDPTSPDEIDRLWLYRFWQEVRFERRSLGYFSAWPLIPVQGSRLVTCGRPDAALCVWRESGASSSVDDVLMQFKASTEMHETMLADREHERRELMELSKNKLLREELVSGASDSGDSDDDDDDVKSEMHDSDVEGDVEEQSVNRESASDCDVRLSDAAGDGVEEMSATAADERVTASNGAESSAERARMRAEDGAATAVVIDMVEVVSDHNAVQSEYCSREALHSMLTRLNAAMVELAFFRGQESDMVPSSRDVAISVLDCLATSNWSGIDWRALNEIDATFLAEFFSYHSSNYGGFNRMHLQMLKQVPMFVNICDVASAIDTGDFYLVPPEIDLATIPLPPNARQSFLKMNPRLTAFYRDLGVQEMSHAKLLIFLLPSYGQLAAEQRDTILSMIQQHWQTLRGDSELTRMLKTTALFRDVRGAYQPASAFFDPRNKVLATIYRDAPEQFPVAAYESASWLDLMNEIGLHSELTVEIFIGCARRVEALFANKPALQTADETLVLTLHQYFVQNFERFDRSRNFFETIAQIAFVPAVRYERAATAAGSFASRTIVVTYADCATPDDQALVFTSKPILLTSAVPPRILWSRLNIVSPPAKDVVLAHLFDITGSGSSDRAATLQWQFYLPMVEVFQELFKYLQQSWDALSSVEQRRVADAAIVPIGSSLVKGARLYFHLGESLAPLMFEVPRAYGAYDTLFRRLGSKDTPEVEDYVALLEDLHAECAGNALNLNELVAVARIVNLLADTLADSSQTLSIAAKRRIHLPSSASVMEPLLQMAYNDSPWLCARIDLAELHVVHPRISTRWCQVLGVLGVSAVVTEELHTASVERLPSCDALAHINAMLASQQLARGIRTIVTVQQQKAMLSEPLGFIPDFEAIDERIVALANFEVAYVDTLQSRFVAQLDHPLRRVDVTKCSTSLTSLSFIDRTARVIYVAKRTLEAQSGLRLGQVVAGCINQLLGGILRECASVESILACDVTEVDALLQLMNVCEDTNLITEKLRGVVGEPLVAPDRSAVELAPLQSHLVGELVAVEVDGQLQYGKVVHERASGDAGGVSSYEVKVSKTLARWFASSQIYTFRSARQVSSSRQSQTTDDRDAAIAASLLLHEQPLDPLPASLVVCEDAASQQVALTNSSDSASAAAAVVPAASVVSAVNDMLSRFNVSLSTEYETLLHENLRLRQRLAQAEDGRRAATAQIDDAIREMKDAQDSLVCAICLESKVDRVLIPCGHIYCGLCVERLPRPSCPICRQHIASSSTFHVPS